MASGLFGGSMSRNGTGDTAYIYGLYCPIAEEIRYVGRSVRPVERLYQHMDEARTGAYMGTAAKRDWLRELLEEDKEPELVILRILESGEDANEAEIEWMHRLLDDGCELVNRVPKRLEARLAEESRKRKMLEEAIERGRKMFGA